jgi:hypothetical protein
MTNQDDEIELTAHVGHSGCTASDRTHAQVDAEILFWLSAYRTRLSCDRPDVRPLLLQ